VHPKRETKKNICKGKILKKFFAGDKPKLAYFTGNKNIFTLIIFITKSKNSSLDHHQTLKIKKFNEFNNPI
jgi:hypothetical protein